MSVPDSQGYRFVLEDLPLASQYVHHSSLRSISLLTELSFSSFWHVLGKAETGQMEPNGKEERLTASVHCQRPRARPDQLLQAIQVDRAVLEE